MSQIIRRPEYVTSKFRLKKAKTRASFQVVFIVVAFVFILVQIV